MRRLVLWDIDGTLLSISPVGQRVMSQVICRLFGLPPDAAMPPMAGRTDQQILRDAIALHALGEPPADDVMAGYQAELVAAMHAEAAAIRQHGRVLPGVVEALRRLSAEPVLQTLLTGNLQAIARLKLETLGLAPWLDLEAGAYGSDHYHRPALVPIAVERSAARSGYRFAPSEIVVIGDTPHDIDCGQAYGARTIAVATERFSAADLRAYRPDLALDDLRDTEALVQAILE